MLLSAVVVMVIVTISTPTLPLLVTAVSAMSFTLPLLLQVMVGWSS